MKKLKHIIQSFMGTDYFSELNTLFEKFSSEVDQFKHGEIVFVFKAIFLSGKVRTIGASGGSLYRYSSLEANDLNLKVVSDRLGYLVEEYDDSVADLCIVYYETGNYAGNSAVHSSLTPKKYSILSVNDPKSLCEKHYLRKVVEYFPFDSVAFDEKVHYKLIEAKQGVSLVSVERTPGKVNIVIKTPDGPLSIEESSDQSGVVKRCVKRYGVCFYYNELDKNFYYEVKLHVNELKPVNKHKAFRNKILTFDVETYLSADGKHIPYSVGYYDGRSVNTYYSNDFGCVDDMFLECFKSVFGGRYLGYTFYFHNLSGFDGILVFNTLKIMLKDPSFKLSVVRNNGLLVSYVIQYKNHLYNINDSYLMLPLSLRALCKTFSVDHDKGFFPYKFVNEGNLDYCGDTPDFSYYYNQITFKEYASIKSKTWNLKTECLKYLSKDLISTYEVLKTFSDVVFKNFSLNVTKYKTLPSLALGLYLSNFYKGGVCSLSGKAYYDIKRGYFGGRNEVFEQPKPSDECHVYDMNSLYSFVMLMLMPVGKPVMSSNKILEEIFGFVYATVKVPSNSKYPPIPVRTDNGLVFGTGTFKGMYFSEELKYAKLQGCEIEVHYSYVFEKGEIFNSYVANIFKLKADTDQGRKLIGKLLLNALYGKFGMEPKQSNHVVIGVESFDDFVKANDILDFSPIDDDFIDVEFSNKHNTGILNDDLLKHPSKVNVAIAAAVTAYGRIHLHKMLTKLDNLGIVVFYCDTDSVFTNKRIPDELVDANALGMFKKEYADKEIECAVFPGCKAYGVRFKDGSEIVKCKGAKSGTLSMQDIKDLMHKDYKETINNQMFKSLFNSTIRVKDVLLRLPGASAYTKRTKIFNERNEWVSTKPLHFELDLDEVDSNLRFDSTKSRAKLEGQAVIRIRS